MLTSRLGCLEHHRGWRVYIYMVNKVIGFQITASDESKINEFYSNAFGWRLSKGPHTHVTNLDTGNETLEGSVIGRGKYIPDYVSLFVETSNINETLKKCISNGGFQIT